MGRRQINGGGGDFWGIVPPPSMSPAEANGGGGGLEGGDHWRSFDNSVNAVSFGFVATAILISMFLVMAIFERFLRRTPSPSGGGRNSTDLVAQMRVQRKLDYPSPEMTFYANGVSVLMPGEEVPTFIAHPVPAPSPPECTSQVPLHHQHGLSPSSPSSTSTSHSSS
ncbi:uncharacterized protein LOC129877673 [Solanum dulcamara]|uniref:uncharacterized protein LOC129877673 n=1 Tax=Solanum dulcamara TaxID=45834 RepID=UPI0024855A89|nr:uncharacterized protein LOC129877673 [Solanum dulcamara]